MKLNYRRTLFVGFAFFLICAFWQAYDAIIPKILTDKFGMSQANSGIIMALDNVLALFMLPLFGAISDKCRSRLGKRTPFILFGTLAAAILLAVLSLADGMQLRNLAAVRGMDTPEALETLYDYRYGDTLMTPDGERYALTEAAEAVDPGVTLIPRERFMAMTLDTDDYARYVAPARQAYAHAQTKLHPQALTLFIAILVLLLISMATFRSPAVALMPDVTLKPLRSKGNAVINLMGSAGGILILILGMVFATGAARNALMPYGTFFGIVSILMILSLGIFMLTVREPRFVQEMHQQSRKYGIEEGGGEERRSGGRKLEADERRSLLFILLSIVLWFMGYNAVTSKYSVYADKVLSRDFNMTLIIAQAAAGGHHRLQGGPQKDHPGGRGDADHRLWHGVLPARGQQPAADELHVRPGGHCLGHDQCELLPHGGGNVPRRGCGQVHGLLLHGQHGRADHYALSERPADGQHGPDGAFPLRHGVYGAGLCDHAVCAPRRQQARGAARAGGAGQRLKAADLCSMNKC